MDYFGTIYLALYSFIKLSMSKIHQLVTKKDMS